MQKNFFQYFHQKCMPKLETNEYIKHQLLEGLNNADTVQRQFSIMQLGINIKFFC